MGLRFLKEALNSTSEQPMLGKCINRYILLRLLFAGTTSAQSIQMQPFTIEWRDNTDSLVNLSFLLDAPAGKNMHRLQSVLQSLAPTLVPGQTQHAAIAS